MYKLLRRISSTFKERFDRSKEEGENGATSSAAPQTGSKRRMSDDDDVPNGSLSKRSRAQNDHDGETSELGELRPDENESEIQENLSPASMPGLVRKDTEEVRQVTKGVKEIELEDKKDKGKTKEAPEEASVDQTEEPTSEEIEHAPSKDSKVDSTSDAREVIDVDADADTDVESSVDDVKETFQAEYASVTSDTPSASSESESKAVDAAPASKTTDADAPAGIAPAAIPLPPSDDTEEAILDDSPTFAEPVIKTSNEAAVKVQG